MYFVRIVYSAHSAHIELLAISSWVIMSWVKRQAHRRIIKSGGLTYVRESWAFYDFTAKKRSKKYQHLCPMCGTKITSIHMPNGGWVHRENGLKDVKHPCLHRGDGLSRRKDKDTRDLFDDEHFNTLK